MMIFSYLIFSCLLIIFIFYFIFIFYSDDSQYLEGYKQILNKNTFALDNLILFWIFFSRHKGINSIKLYTGRFIMFSVITNIYNKKTKGPALMELFTATGKLKKFFCFLFFVLTTRDVRCVPWWLLTICDRCTYLQINSRNKLRTKLSEENQNAFR